MTPRPRVSVGIPVHNGERHLAETLETVLAQTLGDFEVIVCDNASTDRTEEICRRYAGQDSRLRYVRHAMNIGAAGNYRAVFELAIAEYFKWAAHDDLLGPEFLARCVEVLDREPNAVLVYPKTKLIDESGHVTADYDDGLHLQEPCPSERFIRLVRTLGLCNVEYGVVRTGALRRTALIAPFIASDRTLLAELTLYGTFWEIPERLFYRRIHASAYSSQTDTRRLLAFYGPRGADRVPLTTLCHIWAYVTAIERAPIRQPEKMRLRRFVLRLARWKRYDMLAEASAALRWQLHRTWKVCSS